jgi:hypothetical protein
MPQELLFELDDVRITPHIGQFGGTSYQIASIGSVRVVQLKKLNPIAIAAFVLGLAVVGGAALVAGKLPDTSFSVAEAGVGVMVAAFLLQLVWPGRAFALVLKTPSGDVRALVSRKKKFVFDVKQALEQAFVARAHHRT